MIRGALYVGLVTKTLAPVFPGGDRSPNAEGEGLAPLSALEVPVAGK